MDSMIFLGVDGGGTKTALTLLSGSGEVAATLETEGAYRSGDPGVGPRHVAEVLGRAVPEVCKLAGITTAQVDYAFFGLPAYGELSADQPLLDSLPAKILGHDRYRCGNDVVCSWAGSLGRADGISVVAGTGSIAYGQVADRAYRSGGWGELFGDEGSGYWIALRGLQLFSMMADGRRSRGPLYELVREHFRISHDLDLLDEVLHSWHSDRGRIAGLSQLVSRAAELGDRHADAILTAAAAELAQLVEALAGRLAPIPDPLSVSYSGGVFGAHGMFERFADQLRAGTQSFVLRTPLHSPTIGAALHAAALAGHPIVALEQK